MLMVDGLDKYQNLRSTVTEVANSRFENNKACIIRGEAGQNRREGLLGKRLVGAAQEKHHLVVALLP